jgi:hypothetical protein
VPKPIEPPRAPRRGGAQELKSQLALELTLNAYAVFGAAIVLRCLLLSLAIRNDLWIGSTVVKMTDIFARPFTFLPGSDFSIVGRLTLADATLLAAVALVPIGIIARPIRPRIPI